MAHRFISRETNRALGATDTKGATSLDDQRLADDTLLVSYDINDLRDREIAYLQSQEMQHAACVALERKAIADSLRDNFQLTGSDLPADSDPRQLHLF